MSSLSYLVQEFAKLEGYSHPIKDIAFGSHVQGERVLILGDGLGNVSLWYFDLGAVFVPLEGIPVHILDAIVISPTETTLVVIGSPMSLPPVGTVWIWDFEREEIQYELTGREGFSIVPRTI